MQTIVAVLREGRRALPPEKLARQIRQLSAEEASRDHQPNELETAPFWTWFIENPRTLEPT